MSRLWERLNNLIFNSASGKSNISLDISKLVGFSRKHSYHLTQTIGNQLISTR